MTRPNYRATRKAWQIIRNHERRFYRAMKGY